MATARIARGSYPPRSNWLTVAISTRYPRLASALGGDLFQALLGGYLARGPIESRESQERGGRLVDFLAEHADDYPIWYADLARLDRACEDVATAPVVARLERGDLAYERPIRLVPASVLVEIATSAHEAWTALARGQEPKQPRSLDWPQTVLMWRDDQLAVYLRPVGLTEAAALRSARSGTSIVELAGGFGCTDPLARATELVVSWTDLGVLAR